MANYSFEKGRYGGPTGAIFPFFRELSGDLPTEQDYDDYVPAGFIKCKGQVLSATQYPGLAAIIGVGEACIYRKEGTTLAEPNQDGSGGTCFYVDYTNERQELVFPDNCDQMCLNVYNDCANGFILWAGPVLMCLSMIFLSFFCTFLRSEGTGEDDIFNFGKLWFFVLFILWASASLSGTAAGVTSSLVTLTLASLMGAFIFLSASFSKEEQKHNQKAMWIRIHEKYGDSLDIVRGLFVVTCSPIVVAYFMLSAINQLVRRIGVNPCAQPSCDSDNNAGLVTVKAKKQLNRMRAWNRAKVFTYAVYWGVAYMILQVLVANLTVVFLSWMIEKTANLGLVPVTGIMCAVGVMMFLLPPVPGVPVYLTLGSVLSAQGHAILGKWAAVEVSPWFIQIMISIPSHRNTLQLLLQAGLDLSFTLQQWALY